jgi:hypothetical protein
MKQKGILCKREKDVERKTRFFSKFGAHTDWDEAVPQKDFYLFCGNLNE